LPDHALHVRVARNYDTLMNQVLQDLAQNENRLRRQHRHALRFLFQICLGGGIAGPIVEQLEDDFLLFQTSRFR
jgi:hypothetical protein